MHETQWVPKYRVTWFDDKTSINMSRDFFTRESAVRYMNILVLDHGWTPKLTGIRFINPPRFTKSK
jgi:hypothetical protein